MKETRKRQATKKCRGMNYEHITFSSKFSEILIMLCYMYIHIFLFCARLSNLHAVY